MPTTKITADTRRTMVGVASEKPNSSMSDGTMNNSWRFTK